jgi:hypothetical protein
LELDSKLMDRVHSPEGAAWGSIKAFFLAQLPAELDDRNQLAYQLVAKAMTRLFGPQNESWETYKNPNKNNTTYVKKKR